MKTNLQQEMDKVTEFLKDMSWKVCPSCKLEWSKLRPCQYFVDGKKAVSYLCVSCSETLDSIEFVASQYPIKKPFDNWPDSWFSLRKTMGRSYKGVIVRKSIRVNIKVYLGEDVVENMAHNWTLHVDSSRIALFDKKQGVQLESYDNIYQTWFAIKKRIENWAKQVTRSKELDNHGSWMSKKLR